MRILSACIISMGFVGCGASDGGSNNGNGMQGVELTAFQGAKSAPSLTTNTKQHQDAVAINTKMSGVFSPFSDFILTFTPEESSQVALILTSSSDDVVLSVSGGEIESKMAFDYGSNDAVVFDSVQGETYEISIFSTDEDINSLNFQLVIVDSNRSSLGLIENEYWVDLDFTDVDSCSIEGSTNAYSSEYIINFVDGYISYNDGVKVSDFTSQSGNAFSYTEAHSDEELSYSYQYEMQINSDTGVITGSGPYTYTSDDVNCSGTSSAVGKIIL